MLYKKIVRPRLFKMDPEDAHNFVMNQLERVSQSRLFCRAMSTAFTVKDKRLERTRMGITFPNPVGLAAGFSKYGTGLQALEALGFGFLEIGGVTPLPQDGNPKPRMFRLEEDFALINRMGFNNPGFLALLQTLRYGGALNVPLAINIGKGKETPLEHSEKDYCECLERLYHHADFFVLNVSSPNTPGLRTLQTPEALDRILGAVERTRLGLFFESRIKKPVLVKVAPDLDEDQLKKIVEIAVNREMDGLIVANTTMTRVGLKSKNQIETGGLSGPPLFERALKLVSLVKELAPELTVIASGGISTSADAWYMLDQAKADLVQIYTALVFEGPGVVREINRGILSRIRHSGLSSIEDVG